MNKGWIVWIALVVVVVIVVYAYTGFNFSSTLTTVKTTSVSTTMPGGGSTSIIPTTTVQTTIVGCASLFMEGVKPYSSMNQTCTWGGGKLGVWVQAGTAINPSLSIVGKDGITYLQGSFNYNTTALYSNVTLPAQNYTVTLTAGSEAGNGTQKALVKFNLTTTPPNMAYSYIYNANFSDGKYTGWNVSGPGFGTAPISITYANSNTVSCYQGSPWKNYVGVYFATTFTCGLSVSPGNLTSEPFIVNPKTPFLNFKIVSPDDSLIYVEILRINGTGETGSPAVVAHFNTYNISLGANVSSTFANVSIPLTTLTNKVVRIKIVASTVHTLRFVAVGDFYLGSLPNSDKWVAAQINITR